MTSTPMHGLMSHLFPLKRSLTGEGVRQTLKTLQQYIPLEIHEVPTGTQVYDWTVPQEWRFKELTFRNEWGQPCEVQPVGYSEPVDARFDLSDLKSRIHTLPDQPNAIPYVTSYYERTWGLCMRHSDYEKLAPGPYYVKIDSELFDGSLTYADLVLRGETQDEILLTTYCCHPWMANNELSGPVVLTYLVKWLMEEKRRYTYRILIAPETIGPLVYMLRGDSPEKGMYWGEMRDHLRERVKAGWVLTMLGGPGNYWLQDSRCGVGRDLSDRLTRQILEDSDRHWGCFYWKERMSDERQWCAPRVDLPICTLMKTHPTESPEYHTSLDDLSYVTEDQLQESLALMKKILGAAENNRCYRVNTIGEPMLGKRGLYNNLSKRGSSASARDLLNVWSYCDGRTTLDIAEQIGIEFETVAMHQRTLLEHKLIWEMR